MTLCSSRCYTERLELSPVSTVQLHTSLRGQGMQSPPRFAASSLTGFATTALERAGMEPAKADAVADILVEGDLLGHTTHGLLLLPLYLTEIEKGQMTLSGQPKVLADHPAGGNLGRPAAARPVADTGGHLTRVRACRDARILHGRHPAEATTSPASPPISNASRIGA